MPSKTKERLADHLPGHSGLIVSLLEKRGITNIIGALEFLDPIYDLHTHDPYLLKDMEKAVKRILKAIQEGEKIVIYSDYDMDGIPGAVIFHDFFKKIGYSNTLHYIPHRNTEGFGLNQDAIEEIIQGGAHLVITVDCGIGGASFVEHARREGVDIIITDHHLPNGVFPQAYAVINPKQEGCGYPFKELCGAAIAWKVVRALISSGSFNIAAGWEKWLLDMVALATISDMVPLIGENRVLARYGLMVLRKSPRRGLQALFEKTRTRQRFVTEDDIGFTIGPRVNAASRMDHPMDAFRLLATDSDEEAITLAEYLEHINNERKGVVASMVKEAKKKLDSRENIGSVIVTGNPTWKPGLLGLVCNSLVETYGKPVFVWGRENSSHIKGSCRGNGDVHVLELMERVEKGIFLEYGGHENSGGFTLSQESVHTLEVHLEKACASSERASETQHSVDAELLIDDIDENLYKDMALLAPFGVGNPKPIFLLKNVAPVSVGLFGKQKNHLKLVFERLDGSMIEAIQFFATTDTYGDALLRPFNLLVHVEKSYFGYRPSLRLRIVDIV